MCTQGGLHHIVKECVNVVTDKTKEPIFEIRKVCYLKNPIIYKYVYSVV